jgi:hypothetical protein
MTDDADDGQADEDPIGMYGEPGDEGFVSSEPDGETAEGGDESGESEDGEGEGKSPRFDTPLVSEDSGEPETAYGTFYVKYAEDTALTLHEVETGQIFTVIENPGIETHEIIEASLIAQPPMQVSYLIDDLDAQYSIAVEVSEEAPTQTVRELAGELDTGESLPINRKGKGEIHILRVDPDEVERIVEELPEDELTHKNAARYDDVDRVEIRSDAEMGLVSVRYLP